MPTDKKLKNLVFNVLTEEQYESATKKEDEFYLTPDNSAEVAVEITANADATNGTITDSQLSVLQASDSNYIMFNHEKFFMNDDGAKEGVLTYIHVGHENSKTTMKFFTITVSTKAWVLTTQSVQTINVIENSDNTVSLEIS